MHALRGRQLWELATLDQLQAQLDRVARRALVATALGQELEDLVLAQAVETSSAERVDQSSLARKESGTAIESGE